MTTSRSVLRPGPGRSAAMMVVIMAMLVAGQLLTKQGARQLEPGWDRWLDALPYLLMGYTLLFSRGLVWVALLRHMALSLAYPLVALSYVVIIAASRYLFDEQVGSCKLVGAGLVVVGVALLGVSKLRAQRRQVRDRAAVESEELR